MTLLFLLLFRLGNMWLFLGNKAESWNFGIWVIWFQIYPFTTLNTYQKVNISHLPVYVPSNSFSHLFQMLREMLVGKSYAEIVIQYNMY